MRELTTTLTIVILVLVSGCHQLKPGQYSELKPSSLHIIAADKKGHPVDPLALNRLSDDAYEARVRETVAALTNSTSDRVVIHIHGGMVPLKKSVQQAFDQTPIALADNTYPIFLTWHSELWSSYRDHLMWIRSGERKGLWGPVTMPFYLLADAGRGLCRTPIGWYGQLRTDWNTGTVLRKDRHVEDGLDFHAELLKRFQEDPSTAIAVNRVSDKVGFWDSASRFSCWLITLPTKYIVSVPLLEMVGTPAWDNMMRRTSLVFDRQEDFEIRNTDASDPAFKLENGRSGPFGLFLNKLTETHHGDGSCSTKQLQTNCESGRPEVILVAHSMGAIVANQILHHHPEFKIDQIVYMGAACSVRDGYEAILPYMEKHPDTKFYNLCLNWRAEKRETNFLDLPIRGSLLEWLDSIFVQPETVLDQRMGKWITCMRTAGQIPPHLRNRITFKTFDAQQNGSYQNPVKHGEFDDDDFWNEDYWSVPR